MRTLIYAISSSPEFLLDTPFKVLHIRLRTSQSKRKYLKMKTQKQTQYDYLRRVFDDYKSHCIGIDQCILWPFRCNETGHGKVIREGKTYSVPRLILQWKLGLESYFDLKKSDRIHHLSICKHRSCVNPMHICRAVSANTENNLYARWWELPTGIVPTAFNIAAIRRDIELKRDPRTIARRHGVSTHWVSGIASREAWGHV